MFPRRGAAAPPLPLPVCSKNYKKHLSLAKLISVTHNAGQGNSTYFYSLENKWIRRELIPKFLTQRHRGAEVSA
jgi:hypothetical protein